MKVGLVGNQNSGKTTLFNCLTGMHAKIGNWAGVTIEKKVGIIKGTDYEITDIPGIYSLSPYSIEEEISKKYIFEENPDVIINIVDATCLERSLYLTTQLLETNCNIIVALNMTDKLEDKGLIIDEQKLEKIIGTKVFKVSALKGIGIEKIIKEIKKQNLIKKEKVIPDYLDKNYNINKYEELANKKYEFIENIVKKCVQKKLRTKSVSDKIDKIVLNKWLAFPIFIAIMFFVYYLSVGVMGKVTSNLIENIVNVIAETIDTSMKQAGIARWVNSLVIDGIIIGVGSVLNFVPQLVILFLCITLLETSGYMSRVSLLLDRIFRKIGLSGKSLIPFIIGSGCSVPGIMGTRIIENEDERNITTILTPFIPCSAKLPIIALFAGYFFPESAGLVAVSFYFFAIIIIIFSAIIMKYYVFKNVLNTYVAELPEYKLPSFKYVIKEVFDKIIAFIKRAGSVILMCSIIVWFLLSFSVKLEYGVEVKNSILATIGNNISWFFYPIVGTNSWEVTVSAIQGLIAKEQVVSSMAVINGLSEGSEIFIEGGGFEFFTPISAYAFIVFNLFSAPCFGAIGAMKKELGNNKILIKAISFQTITAWFIATFIYQIGTRIEKGLFNVIDIIFVMGVILISILIIKTLAKQKEKRFTSCTYCNRCMK